MDDLDETLSRLITACHVLHHHKILDEQGHISVRHPHDPSTFFSSNVPAILVSSKNDLNQWNVVDGSPVSRPYGGCEILETIPEYSEHFIHSSIYDRFPGVQSIVDSHNVSAIVYGLCDSRGSLLQPSSRGAGFLGSSSPIFDTADHYSALPPDFPHNLLISYKHLGDALAKAFSKSLEVDRDMPGHMNGHMNGKVNGEIKGNMARPTHLPDHGAVFQRGHGFVTWATNIEDAVYRAIHLCRDAEIQTRAMMLRNDTQLDVVYLNEREARDCERTINRTSPLTWLAWTAQVERSGQYHNSLKVQTR
jgi:ribulose-5-phosphate 4-epimerase/fuculose-1-phosphate aldolase